MACSPSAPAMVGTKSSWDKEVSEVDVLDIAQTCTLTDLEDVCVRLGLTHIDIQNTKLSNPLSPAKKHAQNILNLWRDRNGQKATRGTLIDAMEKCQTSADELKTAWNIRPSEPDRKKTNPVVSEPCDPKIPESIMMFKNELKDYYQDVMAQLPLLPWLEEHEMKHIDDIFVDLELETKGRMDTKPVKLEKYENLVTLKHQTKKDKFATRVLVRGEAGSGKTSLMSKIAYSWSQQNHPLLNQFELVFHLRMRNLHSCNKKTHCLRMGDSEEELDCSLLDEVFQQIPKTQVDRGMLEKYIESNEEKILILLDGWDESVLGHEVLEKSNVQKPEHDIENLLISKKQPSSCIIITSRPYKSLGKVQAKYSAVNLKGFSDKNVKEYINKFFHKKVERSGSDIEGASENVSEIVGEECDKERGIAYKDELEGEALALYNHLKTSDILLNLAKIPVMLMLICWMSLEKNTLPKQQTELYDKFVCAIWERFCDKENYDHGDKHDALVKLGKIALIGIIDERLVFKERELPDCKTGVKLGLLIEEKNTVDFRTEKSVSFLHKSFQEFCAAYFLVNTPNELKSFFNSLDSWDAVLSKQEVLLFCCGLLYSKYQGNDVPDEPLPCCRLLCSMFPGHDVAINHVNIIKHAIDYCIEYGKNNNCDEIDVGYKDSDEAQYNILPVLILLNECGHLKPYRDLIIFNKLRVFNTSPQTLPIFHQFVKSHGNSLCTIQSIKFDDHTCASLNVISDTLSCMPSVSDVDIRFSVNDTGVASESSMTQLGKSIAALPDLSTLKVWFAGSKLDVSVILDHLSQSPSKTLTHIDFSDTHVGDAISHMGGIIPHLVHLTLQHAGLEDKDITELCHFLPNASCLKYLYLWGNPIGNDALHILFTHIYHCTSLILLDISASIDCNCTHLVKECVTAASERYDADYDVIPVGEYIPLDEDSPVEACEFRLRYVFPATMPLLGISRNAATKPTQT